MRRYRPVISIGLLVALVGAAVLCSGMKMASAASTKMAADHSCCSSEKTPATPSTNSNDCDRCEVGPIGGPMGTVTLKSTPPRPAVSFDLFVEIPTTHLPILFAATPSLASHSPPALSLVELHCQLTI